MDTPDYARLGGIQWARRTEVVEQARAASEQDRGQVDLDLAHQAGGEALLGGAGAVHSDHVVARRRLRLLDRCGRR